MLTPFNNYINPFWQDIRGWLWESVRFWPRFSNNAFKIESSMWMWIPPLPSLPNPASANRFKKDSYLNFSSVEQNWFSYAISNFRYDLVEGSFSPSIQKLAVFLWIFVLKASASHYPTYFYLAKQNWILTVSLYTRESSNHYAKMHLKKKVRLPLPYFHPSARQ